MDSYDKLVLKFSEMLGFYGEDPDEAGLIIDQALLEGFSMKEIKKAFREAKAEFV